MYTDSYGGTLAGEDEASYLFSDDASTKDTIRYVAYLLCGIIICTNISSQL